MANHDFSFAGGDLLRKMDASWFVSYYCYLNGDTSQLNWQNVSPKSCRSRKLVFRKSKQFHLFWLNEILKMDPNKLGKNKIGLTGSDVVNMANTLLQNPQFLANTKNIDNFKKWLTAKGIRSNKAIGDAVSRVKRIMRKYDINGWYTVDGCKRLKKQFEYPRKAEQAGLKPLVNIPFKSTNYYDGMRSLLDALKLYIEYLNS